MVIAREDVRASFHKGVLWLHAGQGAKDRLPSLMLDLAGMVHEIVLSKSCRPPRKAGEQADDGVAYITEMVAEDREHFLVVVDDVWEVEILRELKRVGAWVLYTTRHDSLLPDAPPVQINKIAREEAEMVLRRAADLDEDAVLPNAAYELMRRCEFVVLDIAFVGRWGVVRRRGEEKAWQMALDSILQTQTEGESEVPLSWRAAMLRAGLEALADDNPLNKELYLALAVLPKGLTFPLEVAAALLFDDVLSVEDQGDEEDLQVAEEIAATLERWSILTREDGRNYRVHDEHSDFIKGCLTATTRDRVLPRLRKYVSGVPALLTFPGYDLVKIWDMLASEEGDVTDYRPYERELEAMDASSAELPRARRAAGRFHKLRKDWESAFDTYSKLLESQESTNTSDSLEHALETLVDLFYCARWLGRSQEAAEIQRRSDAISEQVGREPVDLAVASWFELNCLQQILWCCCLDDSVDYADDELSTISTWCVDDSTDRSVDRWVTRRKPGKWCVEDSAVERVFIPDRKNTPSVSCCSCPPRNSVVQRNRSTWSHTKAIFAPCFIFLRFLQPKLKALWASRYIVCYHSLWSSQIQGRVRFIEMLDARRCGPCSTPILYRENHLFRQRAHTVL